MSLSSPQPNSSPDPVSRQAFLRQGLSFALGKMLDVLPTWPEALEISPNAPILPGIVTLRPPGAIAEADFIAACPPHCTDCRDACPRASLIPDADGRPVLIAETAPCVMCVDVPCTTACPTEALTPLTDPRQIALGTAVIELTQCIAFRGEVCRTCYTTCPLPDEAIQILEGLPQIVPEGCTGCGVCVFHCPEPEAIAIRPAVR